MRIRVPGTTKESRALERLARLSIDGMQASFLRAVRATQSATVIAEVERAIAVGDYAGAVQAIPLDAQMVTKLGGAFMKEYRDVFDSAGAVGARLLPTNPRNVAEYSVVDPRAMNYIQSYGAQRVVEITNDQRVGLQRSIASAVDQGFSARDTAKLIKGEIGLHSAWMRAVDNRRAKLMELGLSKETVAARVAKYANQLLDARAFNIARTEIQGAITQGELEAAKQAIDQGLLEASSTKVWAANPDTEHEDCATMDGQEVGITEPFVGPNGESVDGPPLHPSCLLGDAQVAPGGRISHVSKRWFDGDIVIIRTAAGNRLTCTPNHPVLTDAGWVPAHVLNVGGHIISRRFGQWPGFRYLYRQQMPTPIHEIAESFSGSGKMTSTPMPVAPIDFHGDGEGSQVAIIWSDGLLRNNGEPSGGQHYSQFSFVRRLLSEVLNGLGTCNQFLRSSLAPSIGSMGFGQVCESSSLVPYLPVELLCFAGRTHDYSSAAETMIDYVTRYCERASQSLDRFSSKVSSNNLSNRQVAPGMMDLARRFVSDGGFGLTIRDSIVSIDSQTFRGFVYNLQTAHNVYLANNVVTHNCVCGQTIRPGGQANPLFATG